MSRKFQIKRGLEQNLPIFDEAEFGFTTDSKRPFIGSNTGNIELAKKTDLDTTTASATDIVQSVKGITNWDNVTFPVKIGHRGDLVTAPENTMTAYKNCYAWGAPVKLDVTITADKALVTMHDATVDRTTNGTGTVLSKYMQELMGLDAGSKFDPSFVNERIPVVREIFSRFRNHLFIADCKNASAAQPLAQMIKDMGMQKNVIFEGTNFTDIATAKSVDSTITCLMGYLVADSLATAITDMQAHGVTWCAVDFNNTGFTSSFVQSCHNVGIKVIAFDIENSFDKATVDALGVDGYYIEDYPYVGGLYAVSNFALPYSDGFTGRNYFGTGWGLFNNSSDTPFSFGGGNIGRTSFTSTIVAGAIDKKHLIPSTAVIHVTINPKQLNADTSRFTGIQFCLQQDRVMGTSAPTPTGMNGYWFSLRQNGTMQIDKDVSGATFNTIVSKTGTPTMVVGTPIPITISISPTSITITRTDSGDSITINDTTFRGGRLAFVNGGMASQFSSYSISAS